MLRLARFRRIGTFASAVLALMTAVVPARVAGGAVLCVASSHVAIEQRHAATVCVEAATTARNDLDVDADDACFDLALPAPDAMKHGNERTSTTAPSATPVGVVSLPLQRGFLAAPPEFSASARLSAADLRLAIRVFRI